MLILAAIYSTTTSKRSDADVCDYQGGVLLVGQCWSNGEMIAAVAVAVVAILGLVAIIKLSGSKKQPK
jgi:hypothetical protein